MKKLLSVEVGCADIADYSFDERIDIKPSKATTLVCDMRSIPLPYSSVAFIKSAATLEHVDLHGQHLTVDGFSRILIDGGIVWIQTPDKDYWTERLDDPELGGWAHIQMTGGMRDQFDYHNGLLNLEEIINLFCSHGFRCLSARDGNLASGSLDCIFILEKNKWQKS